MKNLFCLLAIMALGTAFFAQAPTTEKKVHVVVKTDNNGVITNMDTTISLDNMEDAQKVLQEMGIDANIQLDSDVKGVRVMKFEVDVAHACSNGALCAVLSACDFFI